MPTSSIMSPSAVMTDHLQAVVAQFDGYLWSMDEADSYVIFNQLLANKIQELTGMTVSQGNKAFNLPALLDPSMSDVWDTICMQARRGESVRLLQEIRIKDTPAFFELSAIPIRSEKKPNGLLCLVKDLTTETLNSHKLRTSEFRFRSLIERGSDIIVVLDGQNRVVYGSPSIENFFGLSDEEHLGKNAWHFVHPDDLPRLAETFFEVLENPGKPIFVEAKAMTRQKEPVWVEGTVTNLLQTEGIHGIVCNFRDVTARKNAERHLLQATIEAQDREREEIGRELHDNVNQILTTARLYLDCIESGDHMEMIRRSSEIITSAIEEIRKLSHSMTQTFHPELGLKLSVQDLVDSIRRLSEGIQVRLDYFLPDEEILETKLKTTLFRIVQEQLNNVLKHSGARSVEVSLRQLDNYITLSISDDGKGFDPGKKRDGIGISNIINRAEVFQGKVNLETAPDKGCMLSVKIPMVLTETPAFGTAGSAAAALAK